MLVDAVPHQMFSVNGRQAKYDISILFLRENKAIGIDCAAHHHLLDLLLGLISLFGIALKFPVSTQKGVRIKKNADIQVAGNKACNPDNIKTSLLFAAKGRLCRPVL